MAEYIDRGKAVLAACEGADAWDGGCNASRDKYLAEHIGGVPTADVALVKHGTWRDTGSGQECSVCKEIQYGYDTGRFFCANCGAKMDGEEAE